MVVKKPEADLEVIDKKTSVITSVLIIAVFQS